MSQPSDFAAIGPLGSPAASVSALRGLCDKIRLRFCAFLRPSSALRSLRSLLFKFFRVFRVFRGPHPSVSFFLCVGAPWPRWQKSDSVLRSLSPFPPSPVSCFLRVRAPCPPSVRLLLPLCPPSGASVTKIRLRLRLSFTPFARCPQSFGADPVVRSPRLRDAFVDGRLLARFAPAKEFERCPPH